MRRVRKVKSCDGGRGSGPEHKSSDAIDAFMARGNSPSTQVKATFFYSTEYYSTVTAGQLTCRMSRAPATDLNKVSTVQRKPEMKRRGWICQ